ncbi:MAG: inositol monophosphatase [Clostridia bacterium]|nr:inositol monophosphatase [Clostridia bacterium]
MKYGKYSQHINFMIKAVKIGEKIVNQNKFLRVIDKGEFDIVTNVDLEIEQAIIRDLGKIFPDIPIISEESCNGALASTCFVIDPVDGTKNFYHGTPIWGIQMAYIENGEPVASVLYCPEINLQVVAGAGIGAYSNGKKMYYEPKNLDHSMVCIDGPQCHRWNLSAFLDNQIQAIRILGSTCVGFAMVVSGQIDGYIYMCDHPWDLLPGLGACKNAGLYVYDNNKSMAIVANSARLLEFMKASVLEQLKK